MITIQNDAAAPTTDADTLLARPIPAADLDEVRSRGEGEPLRCCLRYARAGEAITLISYSPEGHGVWREVGPVYVHADTCLGPTSTSLPEQLRTGPRVLRAYRPDGSMRYEQNTLVPGDEDLEGELRRLLRDPDVSHVHVRTVLPLQRHHRNRHKPLSATAPHQRADPDSATRAARRNSPASVGRMTLRRKRQPAPASQRRSCRSLGRHTSPSAPLRASAPARCGSGPARRYRPI